jgi:hypothetical protein
MRSVMRKSVLLAGAFLLFAGATASASGWNVMEVKVPFSFVVNGHTLPAGRYTVEQEGGSALLLRGEKDNHAAAFAMTVAASGQDPAGPRPTLTFTRHENQYRLSSVWESGSEGWSIVSH